MIWAQDRGGAIGTGEGLPWRVPADFRHFRACTLGHPVIMGRRTFLTLGEEPLPKRRNIVVSRREDYRPAGVEVAASVEEAVALCASSPAPCWIIGGGEVYRAGLPLADLLVVTTIDLDTGARVLAPAFDTSHWRPVGGAWAEGTCASDPPHTWRERSGDARWRVDVYRRDSGGIAAT